MAALGVQLIAVIDVEAFQCMVLQALPALPLIVFGALVERCAFSGAAYRYPAGKEIDPAVDMEMVSTRSTD